MFLRNCFVHFGDPGSASFRWINTLAFRGVVKDAVANQSAASRIRIHGIH